MAEVHKETPDVMSFMNKERSWYKNRMIAVLAMMCGTLGLSPLVASAHHITETPKADCVAQTVTVTVSAWAGNVEITRTSPLPVKVTEVTPTLDSSGNGSAVASISDIGGNGDYTAGRQGFPNDPTPVAFTVNCPKAQPAIATSPSAGGVVGTAIHDVATLSGGLIPTGDVTFNLYDPSQATCAGTPVFAETHALVSGQATSGNYTTVAVGTYRWIATYNGDANNLSASSGCQDEQVTTTKAQPAIATSPSAGGVVGTVIRDVATVSGGLNPTGDVTFNLYDPSQATCDTAPVLTETHALVSGQATSSDYTTAAVGTYRWTATYNGDAMNLGASSGCQDEQVTTTMAQPAIATSPSAGGVVGTVIRDVATVSGGLNPTGDVTFNLYDPSQANCDGAPVLTETQALVGGQATSSDYTTGAVGTYRWTATYNGDANNLSASSGCQDEQVTTTKAQPAITTAPSDGGVVGTVIHDVANVSGGHNPTGDVTFNLYDPSQATCAGTPVLTETHALVGGQATSSDYTTAAVGTYRWTATYNGDASNLTVSSGCQAEQVVVTSPESGVLAASVSLPDTGRSGLMQGLLLALLMVLLGIAVLLGQAYYRPQPRRVS